MKPPTSVSKGLALITKWSNDRLPQTEEFQFWETSPCAGVASFDVMCAFSSSDRGNTTGSWGVRARSWWSITSRIFIFFADRNVGVGAACARGETIGASDIVAWVVSRSSVALSSFEGLLMLFVCFLFWAKEPKIYCVKVARKNRVDEIFRKFSRQPMLLLFWFLFLLLQANRATEICGRVVSC